MRCDISSLASVILLVCVSRADRRCTPHSRTAIDEERRSIRTDSSLTIGPKDPNHIEPLFQLLTKAPRVGILDRFELVCQAVPSKQRNEFLPSSHKTSIGDPSLRHSGAKILPNRVPFNFRIASRSSVIRRMSALRWR